MELPEDNQVKESLRGWIDEPNRPLAVDILVNVPNRTPLAIETWTLHCDAARRIPSRDADIPVLYKSMSLLLRSIIILSKVLPGYKMRLAEEDRALGSFSLSYSLRSATEPERNVRDYTRKTFPTFDSTLGQLRVSCFYLSQGVLVQPRRRRATLVDTTGHPPVETSPVSIPGRISEPLGSNLIDDYVSPSNANASASAPVIIEPHTGPKRPTISDASPPLARLDDAAFSSDDAVRLGLLPNSASGFLVDPPMHVPSSLDSREASSGPRTGLTVIAPVSGNHDSGVVRATKSPLRNAPIDRRNQQGDETGLSGPVRTLFSDLDTIGADDSNPSLLAPALSDGSRRKESELGEFIRQCRAAPPLEMFKEDPFLRALDSSNVDSSNMETSTLSAGSAIEFSETGNPLADQLKKLRGFHLSDV